MTTFTIELRTSLRSLLRAPGFLVAAVLTLALGLGANAILFNAVHALLWRPLAFPESERLVSVVQWSPRGERGTLLSRGTAALLRDRADAFSEIGLTGYGGSIVVHPDEEGLELSARTVNTDYLAALSFKPLCGRSFTEQEEQGAEPVALLTESTWRTHFGADPGIVGRIVPTRSGGQRGQLRIIGVVPGRATLPFAAQADVLLPMPSLRPFDGNWDGNHVLYGVLRLKPGLRSVQAVAKVQAVLRAAEERWPASARGIRYDLEPTRAALAPSNRKVVLLLYGAAALLLMLTCANVASLFLDRALARTRETAVRLVVGASLRHVLRAFFLESLLVCGTGSLLALVLERLARPLVLTYLPHLKALGPELLNTGSALLWFGLLSCLAVALAVALLPTLQARNPLLAAELAQGGQRGSRTSTSWRSSLAAAQVAIILVLLTVGGLVGRSFRQALRVDPGFDPRGVMTFKVALPPMDFDRQTPAAYELLDLIKALPGTRSASFALESPLGENMSCGFHAGAGGYQPTDPNIDLKLVGSDYVETLAAHIITGRTFTEDEVRRFSEVAILSESAARLLFGDEDPIGRVAKSGIFGRQNLVVGVVKDIRINGLDREAPPVAYLPHSSMFGGPTFLVRTQASPAVFTSTLRTRVKAMNAGIRLGSIESLQQATENTIQDRRRAGVLVGGFALLGLLIGSVGLYGTLSSQVRERRREMGIRLALGATPQHIVQRILDQGGRLVGLGATAGLAGSAVAARLVQKELYGISPMDVPSFALALALLLSTALLACLIPARRAAKVDPMVALRCE